MSVRCGLETPPPPHLFLQPLVFAFSRFQISNQLSGMNLQLTMTHLRLMTGSSVEQQLPFTSTNNCEVYQSDVCSS